MSNTKISANQAVELAERWLSKTRSVNLKAKGPASLWLAREHPDLYEQDTWSVYFEIDAPGLRTTSLDHMILHVDDETGEVWQFYPFNVVADDEDDEE
jgi:hypothetical protein